MGTAFRRKLKTAWRWPRRWAPIAYAISIVAPAGIYGIIRTTVVAQYFPTVVSIIDFVVLGLWISFLLWVGMAALRIPDRIYARSRIARIREHAGALLGGHIASLLRKGRKETIDRSVFELSTAAVRQYLNLLCPLHDASEANVPILPGNFRIYARCVQEIMAQVDRLLERDDVSRATIYTYFPRTIFEWYNPFIKIELDDARRPNAVGYTEDWWEAYKRVMSRYKDTKNNKNVLLIRLMAHPSRFTTIERDKEIDFTGVTEKQFRDTYFVHASSLMEPAIPVSPGEVDSHCALSGYLPVVPINPNERLYTGEFRENAQVHCILQRTAGGIHASHLNWYPLLDHFVRAHHTSTYSKDNPPSCGCYVSFSKTAVFPWGKFADVFVVALETDHKKGTDTELFGVALQTDGFNDAEGIRFLRTGEIKKFIDDFKIELSKSSNQFCTTRYDGDAQTVAGVVEMNRAASNT
jgi:hypothetical protein